MKSKHVAIIGAGLSGLTCAQKLTGKGHRVTIFDKGRGVAGRMSVRRTSDPSLQFDHGAQYFTARHPAFQQQVEKWIQQNVVAIWEGPFVSLEQGEISAAPGQDSRYVGTPGMNALCKAFAKDLEIHCSQRVSQMIKSGSSWKIVTDELTSNQITEQPEVFDHIILTIPPAQAVNLLPENSSLHNTCKTAIMDPCRCVMLAFESSLNIDFGAAFVQNSPLRWIACENSKPGRNSQYECWTLHASPEWSQEYVDATHETTLPLLLDAFASALGKSLRDPVHTSSHRWLYAIPRNPLSEGSFQDAENQITICGDWCHEARVEGAYMSGLSAADKIL
ncbi:FAD-dependent oxidoreductase [uncultured Rubinisphaera sp.]|uniref:NAD(P)/FAD-dependent oxidoreductase n=1 Tax=uncultured Rubinisphaera sp. TaxID=1678686 RepID=UPI0030DA076A